MGTLRFVLSILVAISHIRFFSPICNQEPRALVHHICGFNPGVFAVVIFYILSGYCMSVMIKKYYLNPFNLKGFYQERITRLYPQFLFYLFISGLYLYFLAPDSWVAWKSFITPSTWVLNILMLPLDYEFLIGQKIIILNQTWSLGLEFSFYILIPILLVIKSGRLISLLVLASLFITLMAFLGKIDTDLFGYRILPGTLYIFLCGYFLSQNKKIATLKLLFIYCITCLFAYLLIINPSYLSLNHNLEVTAGLLVGIPIIALLHKMKTNTLDVFLGILSYGIFLNHVTISWIYDDYFTAIPKDYRLITILITSCFFACVSYNLVELPTLYFRHKLREVVNK